jgi:hypothetical protein
MSSVVIAGDTSGSITLQAPAVAGSTVLTLPAQTGTVMVNGPAFSAYLASNQFPSSSTWTKIALSAKTFDTNTNFDAGTNYRFTPTVAGYYMFTGIIYNQWISTNSCYISIYKNGTSNVSSGNYSALNNITINIAQLIYLNGSTDYVELWGWQSTNGNFLAGANNTSFSGFLARSA